MRTYIANLYRLGMALILIVGAAGFVHGQDAAPVKCKSAGKVRGAPKYRVADTYRTVESETIKHPPTLVMHISVKPEHFTREEMVALAEQLKRDYCEEPRLGVFIFSDHRAAKYFTGTSNTPAIYWNALRGDYTLDRSTGEEYVMFSPDPAKPREEVKIVLGNKGTP